MKREILSIIFLATYSSLAFSSGELSCKKIIPINVTEGWKRNCTYHGSSINEAYPEYRNLTQNLGEAPNVLPNKNRRYKTSRNEVEININWKNKNHVFVAQTYPEAENSGMEVGFKKIKNVIQITEIGWTP